MNPSSRAVVRRLPPAGAAIMAALLLAGASAISTAFAQATGGFIEKADSLAARPRWTPAQIRSFLPRRGEFTFPAPYNTGGVRLTSPSDCGGGDCVLPLSGSSGRNINNHRGRDTMLIFLGLRGSGPTLFGYDKRTDQVRNLGPLFDAASPFASHSGEGWYFSATRPSRLYVSDGGPALLRYDVETRAFETVFDATGQFGEGIGIDRAHSSDDDTVHSALLRDSTSHRVLGCLAYGEKVQRFSYYPATADGDECEVDKSGRWLLIRQRAAQADAEDDRIVDLETGAEKTLIGETATGGPSDTGHGYLVAKDASSSLAAAVRIWDFEQSPPPGRVLYQASSATGDLRHIAHSNAQSDVELSRQFACGSTGTTPSGSRPGEIVCFRLDGSQDVLVVAPTMMDPSAARGGGSNPKLSNGNLDVTGRYFLWVSNTGGRADAFMVKVPADLLMGPGSNAASPILPTTTAAAPVPAGSLSLGAVPTTITDLDTVVTLSPEDTFLNVNARNESTNSRLMTYTWPDHEVANAILMKFDLSVIPAGAVVTDAKLQLALVETDATADSTYVITAHKVMGRSPVIGAATGYTADGVAAWTPNTCCSGSVPLAQADISAAYDTQAIDKTPGYKSWSLTAMAQEWVADPMTNFGVLLNSDASTLRDRYRFFASMEQVDTSLRPSLTIAYSSKADVTAPVISAVAASAITISGAAISWTTNEPSDSQVEDGTTTAYGSLTTLNKTRVKSHAAALSGLAASTLYHFRVQSRDFAGNLAVSSDFMFTTLADLIPPAVSITAPTTGTTLAGTVTIAASASDNVGVAGVQFKVDGANAGAEDASSPYFGAWNTTTVTNGSHTLTAVARDVAGNVTTSAAVTVTVASGVVTLVPQDTFLNLNATNQSTNTRLMTYTWPDYRVANAILMKFDLSAIPPGAVVTDATLQLALVASDAAAENTYTVTAHRMVGRNPVITAATGYTADGVTAWTPNSCCSSNVPLAQADISAAYDTRAIDKTPGYKSWSLTAMVQEWVASPATNFGLLLDSDASKLRDHYRYFASMEYADPGLRPSLRITYSLDPDVTPPVLSAVTASAITISGAAINWTTDEPSDSQVEYGTTTAYGSLTTLEGIRVMSHAATLTGLAANTLYHFRVRSQDLAGNLAVSGDSTLTTLADLAPPVVSITAPTTGATATGTLTVAASASDNVAVAGVQFKLDGVNLGAEGTTPPYSVSWDSTGATNGSHTLTAAARDAAGNVATSAGITVSVANDTTPPSVSITAPAAGASVSGTLGVAATASDDVAVAGVQFKLDGANLGAEGTTAPYSVSWNTTGAANGSHALTAVARDAVGNVTTSAAVTVTVANDTTPPSVSITAPGGGATVAGTVTITASASDDVAVAGVQFKLDGANLGTEDTSSPYSVSWNTAPVANGGHALTAVARDAAGNLTASAGVTVTVANDTTPPSASITAPTAGATVSGAVTVTASASDNVGVAGVQFKLDGANLGAEDTSSPYSASWSTTASSNGSHTLTATARDAAGNQFTSAAVTVTVSNGPPVGIAGLYPGDVGIEAHPDVVFVERFDEPTLSGLFSRWTDILNGGGMAWSPDVPAGSPGTHSVDIPWVGGGVASGGHLYKQLSPGVDDTLYVRYYVKYPTSGQYNHTGVWMGGANPPLAWPNPQAEIKPAGNDRFSAAAERSNATLRFDHYDYWMDMHQSNDGNYWGNLLRNDPSLVVNGGQWMCVEHMVKLNNPVTSSNGEHAIWINGVKVSHVGQGFPNGSWSGGIFTQNPSGTPFGGLRWRSDATLNLNWIWLQNYSPDDPAGFQGHMYFDHLVAAKSYIGCLPASPPSDPTPPVVSITAPAAGTTVSGTVAVAAGATDNVGVVGVQFKLDGANVGAEDTASPYSVSWVSSTAANGPHTLTAVARDAAGNQTASSGVSVTVNNAVSGGVLFESNWDTAAGTSSGAVTDGGRWPNYWEFNGGSSVQLLSVVTGGVAGHNALRVQQRGSTFAANLQLDNFAAPSTDYYVRYYMKNDDTSSAGDHIVTADTYQYANLTYLRKVGGPTSWQHYISLYGCGYTYPIGHWTPSTRLANGQWYRFEYYVHYTGSNRVQVHPRVYNAAGTLILSDADFRQSDFGSASWSGRSDWTLASYYAAGHDFCVDPTWMNDFGLGNNGQFGAADTALYWYFAGLQIRTDTWPGPLF